VQQTGIDSWLKSPNALSNTVDEGYANQAGLSQNRRLGVNSARKKRSVLCFAKENLQTVKGTDIPPNIREQRVISVAEKEKPAFRPPHP
jgi:hypothetical protein